MLPFLLNGPQEPQPARNDTLSSSLPATFDLNWDHCENGSAHPVPSDGCTTCMGPPILIAKDEEVLIIICAAELIRNTGYSVNIIPDDYQWESDETGEGDEERNRNRMKRKRSSKRAKREEMTPREREEIYLRKSYAYGEFKVFDSKKKHVATFGVMGLDEVWIIFTCFNDSVFDDLREVLGQHFILSNPFPHVLEERPVLWFKGIGDGSLRLEAVTGDVAGSETKNRITTLFTVYFRDGSTAQGTTNEKIVAKALCSYQNTEMSTVGPTIELFEVAKEWRKHSLGNEMMMTIEAFFLDQFEQMTVHFSVCYVTNAYASRWFTKHYGFQDLDGMGEELGKTLGEETEDDDEEEDY